MLQPVQLFVVVVVVEKVALVARVVGGRAGDVVSLIGDVRVRATKASLKHPSRSTINLMFISQEL